MGDRKLRIHRGFYARLRRYCAQIAADGRPQVSQAFAEAVDHSLRLIWDNPGRGHTARFEATDLADVFRSSVRGFPLFAIFYRWNADTVTIISVEHTSQDLPARLAKVLSTPPDR